MVDMLSVEPPDLVLRSLAEALDVADIGIVLLNRDLGVRFVNRRMADWFGYTPAFLASGPDFRELLIAGATNSALTVPVERLAAYIAEREAIVRAGGMPPTQIELADGRRVLFGCTDCSDGGRILTYADISHELMREAQGAVEQMRAELRFNSEILENQGAYLVSLAEAADEYARKVEMARLALESEVAERRHLEAELRRQASTDGLTGILNHSAFIAAGQAEMERGRTDGQALSVLMFDVDHFKRINDRYGHAGGDLALQHLVGLLRSGLRDSDLIGRLGGEEFAIVLRAVSPPMAGDIAERLRGRVETSRLAFGDRVIVMTVSVGVAVRGPADRTIEPIIARADEALYRAKAGGRNRVEADPPALAD
jgi:diguanylate cyclase (GGDEF)-like protein